jgi:hypothetical protein
MLLDARGSGTYYPIRRLGLFCAVVRCLPPTNFSANIRCPSLAAPSGKGRRVRRSALDEDVFDNNVARTATVKSWDNEYLLNEAA